jgi:hypothetical protein
VKSKGDGSKNPSQKGDQQRAHERDLRAARRNPITRRIIAQKAELQRHISTDGQLAADFDFLLKQTGWDRHLLLQLLYWDSNMMHADPQTVIGKEKDKTWPIEKNTLIDIRMNIRALAEQIERVNKTEFSPAKTAILCDETGDRFHRADERYLLRAFKNLPDLLRFYGGELSRKLSLTDSYWLRAKKDWKCLVEHARKTSLYEQIRLKTGQYHAVRLHRLVNGSRRVQGLPPVNFRAFVIWLNRLKKRHGGAVD